MANASDNDRQPVLKTIPQAAAYVGVSERTIRRKIKAGELNTLLVEGRICIQPADLDNLVATVRHTPADAGQNDRHMSGALSNELSEALRETIRRQDTEITYLRGELTAIRATLDRVTLMLPAPERTEKSTRGPWILITAATVLAVLGIGGYWLWLIR